MHVIFGRHSQILQTDIISKFDQVINTLIRKALGYLISNTIYPKTKK